jgi:hypothetical protein
VANALLASLDNHGGTTYTMRPVPGSLAIDAGNSIGDPAFNQHGQARIRVVDIDVFETRGFTITVSSGIASPPPSPRR